MQLTIDGNSVDFQIKQGIKFINMYGKKMRGKYEDEYVSENKMLSEFVKASKKNSIILVNVFDNITDFEDALHYLYLLIKIKVGASTYIITADNATLTNTFNGVIHDEVKVTYKREASRIMAEVSFNVTITQ